MVLADLLTAARYRSPITAILLNNGALQMERNKMMANGLLPKGTEITNPDFAPLAEACGWEAYRVESADDLESRLQTSLSGSNPVLLDVPTAQIQYPNYSNS
jgi:pyruvate dehydrogenase (quinone)/pyruvate oxidase